MPTLEEEASAPPPEASSASVSQYLPLSKIVPSKTNPGRAFDPTRDNDTVESIKVHGVLQPILVRPLGSSYEIVAGERRYHCSGKAGKASIPAVIRELTDVQALEIQTIENDQREDLDIMSKAAAFRRLFDAYNKSGEGKAAERMEIMSQRLGRKPRTVWNLLSLNNLSADGQTMLRAGEISQSHAYEICTRTASEQKKILQWIKQQMSWGRSASVRDLKNWIREECDHFLDAAPFPKDDVTLLAGAGACTACPKNTAVNPNLVDLDDPKAKKRAICTDNECFQQKVTNNLVRISDHAKKSGADLIQLSTSGIPPKGAKHPGQWLETLKDGCPHTSQGVIVDGKHAGQMIYVCTATNICKTHFGAGSSGTSNRAASGPRSEAEKKAMLQKQRNKKLDQAYRVVATDKLLQNVNNLKPSDLQDVAIVLFDRLDRRLQNPMMAAMGWKTSKSYYGVQTPEAQIRALKPAQLSAFIALVSVADKILPVQDYYGPKSPITVDGFASRHKIDLEKIHKEAAAPLQEKWQDIDARGRIQPAEDLKYMLEEYGLEIVEKQSYPPPSRRWIHGVNQGEPVPAGSFIKAFAAAVCQADDQNYALLRPSLLALKAKYPQYRFTGAL